MLFMLQFKLLHLKTEQVRGSHNASLLGDAFNPMVLVFYNSAGNFMNPKELYLAYKKAIKRVNPPDFCFHDLRRSHATTLLEKNVHPKIVSDRLGHTKISTTLDIYNHVIPSLQNVAEEVFDNVFEDLNGSSSTPRKKIG